MKCQSCEVCGTPIGVDAEGAKLCLPVIVGTEGGSTRYCWCVCDECKQEFINRSAKVLHEYKESV